ncbi:hypothetical protein C8039_07460 [Halogeometricum sp. wsp3]|nr:hypothetical protein C8039_07460 [Halogeometricum sp. wsp3]
MASITIQLDNTDEATVQVGDKDDDNYYAIAEVTDDDEDGQVYVGFNATRLAPAMPMRSLSLVTTIPPSITSTSGPSELSEEGTAGADIRGDGLRYADRRRPRWNPWHVNRGNRRRGRRRNALARRADDRDTSIVRAPSDTYNDEISDLDDDETAPVYDLIEAGNITQTDEAAINDVNDDIIIQSRPPVSRFVHRR